MKSFFIWFIALIVGALLGFGASYLIGLNVYLSVGVGIILGSSAGVTINVHREKEDEFPMEESSFESASNKSTHKKVNQKSS